MILVTVGMQLAFDRLIKAVDDIAPELGMPVVAQTGKGVYKARNIRTIESIAPTDFDGLIRETRLIVAHAGIGTVLTAQKFSKPILLFPRRAALGEHRNDHQLATVAQLKGRPGVIVVEKESELREGIAAGLTLDLVETPPVPKREMLRQSLRSFIAEGRLPFD